MSACDAKSMPARSKMPAARSPTIAATCSAEARCSGVDSTSARRAAALPQLPTAAESGLPGYEAIGWFGLLAPAATPRELVAKLSADANKAMADPEVRRKMLAAGAEPSGNTPEAFARFIRDDMAKWAKLMAERGIKPEL